MGSPPLTPPEGGEFKLAGKTEEMGSPPLTPPEGGECELAGETKEMGSPPLTPPKGGECELADKMKKASSQYQPYCALIWVRLHCEMGEIETLSPQEDKERGEVFEYE